ncbi:MAG: hypothetical protein ABIQ57_03490 [Candidatus Kapaibacterium sp.]
MMLKIMWSRHNRILRRNWAPLIVKTARTESWSAVIERYANIEGTEPIVRLGRAIAASPRLDFDFLRIHFNFDDGTFAFDYMEHYSIGEKERWRKTVSADESFSGFIHFLVLKRWFPAKEIPRGSWTCDEGGNG